MCAASIAAVGGMTVKLMYWVVIPATATDSRCAEVSGSSGLTVASRSWSWLASVRLFPSSVAVTSDCLERRAGRVEPEIEIRRHVGASRCAGRHHPP